MTSLEAGDRGDAVCRRCEGLVATRYERRDHTFTFDDLGPVVVEKMLVGICLDCGEVVTLAGGQEERVREARQKAAARALAREAEDLGFYDG